MPRWLCVWVAIVGLVVLGCGKPSIDETCTMNGLGDGSCSFTNLGDARGAKCGHITVTSTRGGTASSALFCSGELAPKTTADVAFSIPSVRGLCDERGRPWSEVCSFTFTSGEPEPITTAAVLSAPAAPVIEPTPPPAVSKGWQKHESRDPMDDSTTQFVRLVADEPIFSRFGDPSYPVFFVRCAKNKTEAFIDFSTILHTEVRSWEGDYSYGYRSATKLRLRLDDGPPETKWASPSDDGHAAFLTRPVADLKKMLGKNKLLVEYSAYGSGTSTTTFTITGLAEAAQDLRKACKW